MALATSNLTFSSIASVLGETLPKTIQNLCDSTSVYAPGLNATYCTGGSDAVRLANLQSTPHDMGKFRGYEHGTAGGNTPFTGTVSVSTSATACLSKPGTSYWHNGTGTFPSNGDQVFTNSAGSTYPADGYIGFDDSGTLKWVRVVMSAGYVDSIGNCTAGLNAISAQRSLTTCGSVTSVTVYGSGTTITSCFNSSYKIYTTSAGTAYATSGTYYDTGQSGDDRYTWTSGGGGSWTAGVTCGLNIISCYKSSTACGTMTTTTVYGSGTTIANSNNIYDIFTTSAGTTRALSAYYSDDNTLPEVQYRWISTQGTIGSRWYSTHSCDPAGLSSFSCYVSSTACGTMTSVLVYSTATSILTANNTYDIYTTSAGTTKMANGYYSDDNTLPETQYRYINTQGTVGSRWYSTHSCDVTLNTINCFYSAGACGTPLASVVYAYNEVNIINCYNGSETIYGNSTATVKAPTNYYYDVSTFTTNGYSWNYTTEWVSSGPCYKAINITKGYPTALDACGSTAGVPVFHSGTGVAPANGEQVYNSISGPTQIDSGSYYKYTTFGSYSFYYTTSVGSTAGC